MGAPDACGAWHYVALARMVGHLCLATSKRTRVLCRVTDEFSFPTAVKTGMVGLGSAVPTHPTLAVGDPSPSRRNRSLGPDPPRSQTRSRRVEETTVRSRRDFLRTSLAVGGASMMPKWARADGGSGSSDLPHSPSLRPVVTELPIPPLVRDAPPVAPSRSVPPGTASHPTLATDVSTARRTHLP